MKHLILILTASLLTACSAHSETAHSNNANGSHSQAEGIIISSARVLPPFPGRDTAAGYFEITNHGEMADKLISATSPISGAIEIHNHIEEDGVMKMRQVKGVDLLPGETVVFKPGSFHLMMFNTTLSEGQKDVSVTLNYEKSDPMTLIVDIDGADGDENYGSSHKGKGYGSSHKEGYGSSHKGD